MDTTTNYFFIWSLYFNTTNQLFLNTHMLLIPTISVVYWVKIRFSYLVRSWIYTTNHKRIAMNYFSFIFVSGTAGMGLATVIRLEFAYPGVGVFAGDSLQYLSIATAHGVIMVFFMIMPTLFGAFGNFLLPTQLGVHDVAFPRLNSAAFWFLPGGLVMLAQLVCIDRRYQRMNCFNIRELQSMLKRRFFVDLVNSSDHREFLNRSMVGLRYKGNSGNLVAPDTVSASKLGTTVTSKNKSDTFTSPHGRDSLEPAVTNSHWQRVQSYGVTTYLPLRFGVTRLTGSEGVVSVSALYRSPALVVGTVFSNFIGSIPRSGIVLRKREVPAVDVSLDYNTFNLQAGRDRQQYSPSESANSLRFTRFHNPLISYAPKSGNYVGIWDKLYPSMMTSWIEVTRGVRKASWFFSEGFPELLSKNYDTFNTLFSGPVTPQFRVNDAKRPSYLVQPIYNYFNILTLLGKEEGYLNVR
jgi:hypothetical protein